MSQTLSPFEILARYERLSLTHASDTPEKLEAPGLWRGIGYRVGSRLFVSGIDEISELLAVPSLTPVPGTQPWLLGVANVRGNLVPAIDLRDFIEGERSVLTESSRVLVVRQHAGSVGLLIDEVLGQRSFTDEQRNEAVGEADERYQRFVGENLQLGDVLWGLFSMAALVRAAEFQQGSA